MDDIFMRNVLKEQGCTRVYLTGDYEPEGSAGA